MVQVRTASPAAVSVPRIQSSHLLIAVLAVGLAFRVVGLLARRPLGIDEARLALNVAGRSYAGLLQPLGHEQSAPIVFLWLAKVATDVLGVNETALRLVPLIAGTACVVLLHLVARRLLSQGGAVLATGMAALAPLLLFYSLFAKQYALEAAIAAAMVLLALEALRRPTDPRVAAVLVFGGALAIWASASVPFVLAGVVVALAIERRRAPAKQGRLLEVAFLVWAASFLAAYAAVYAHAANSPYMMRHWAPVLFPPGSEDWVGRLGEAVVVSLWTFVVGYPRVSDAFWFDALRVGAAVLALTLLLLGIRQILRSRGSSTAALLAVPLAATVAAALAGRYPLYTRLLLFTAPLVYVLVAAGVERIGGTGVPGRRRAVQGLLFVLLLVPPALLSLAQVTSPGAYEDLGELTAELRALRQPGEPVYVSSGSLPAWGVYSTDWTAPDRSRLEFLDRIGSPGGGAFENAPSRGKAVADEGRELVYRSPAGPELYGTFTGIEWLPMRGMLQHQPDPGWAENEARRIRDAARPRAWLLVSQARGKEHEAVIALLERSGGDCGFVHKDGDSFLASCTFAVTSR